MITEVTVDDAELLASLIRDSFATVAERLGLTPENARRHPSNCTPDWIRSAFAKGIRYFVLTAAGEPAGCVALEKANEDVCYLERLAVLPTQRRKGFGEALVNHAVNEARELGASQVELGMVAAQIELREWYEKLGFSITTIARFEDTSFDVGFMRKTLVEDAATPG